MLSEEKMDSKINKESVVKWGVIIAAIVISIPLLIALLLNVKIFNFALGNTESWIAFWGSYIGGMFGMIGVIFTTYFIINTQKKVSLEQMEVQKEIMIKQIEAQEKITLQQVSDTDYRARLVLYQQITFAGHERTINLLNDLVLNTQVFGKNAKQLVMLKHLFLVGMENPEKEQLVWIKDALDEMIKSFFVLNNNTISLVDSVKIEDDRLSQILDLFFKLNDVAEIIKTLADKTGTTIEDIDIKILELNNLFKNAHSDLRKYVKNKKEKIEDELVKELKP